MDFWDIVLMTAFVGFSVGSCDSNVTKVFVGIISLIGCGILIAIKLGLVCLN